MKTIPRPTGSRWLERSSVSPILTTLDGKVDRPHWAAQIEDKKNALAAAAAEAAGFQPRIQPYASYGSPSQVRVLGRVLFARPSSAANHHDQPVHDMRSLARRGFRNFLSQVDPHRVIDVELETLDGPLTTRVRTDRSGLIDLTIPAPMAPGRHHITLRAGRGNEVSAPLHVFADDRRKVGVVSDVDDTVMVTLLPRPLLAAWNAFVINQGSRRIVPGMPVLYQKLRREFGEDMPFVYLSTGAWNVSPFLQRFLFKNGYPDGPILLTDWGRTNTGFFRSGQQHKDSSLRSLREMFPHIQWILVGDDGQHDPDIYGDFTAEHPEAVRAVLIRELTDDQQDLAHGATRPVRAVGAAARAFAGLVPKFWAGKASGDSGERGGEGAEGADAGAHAAAGTHAAAGAPSATTTHADTPPHHSPSSAPPAAARTGVPWVSGPDGFSLIRALRSLGLMEGASAALAGVAPTERIDAATDADADALATLVDRAYRQRVPGAWTTEEGRVGGPRETADGIRALIADPEMQLLVARGYRAPDSIDGCIMLEMRSGEAIPELGLFAVEPTLQARGIGRALVAALEAEAASRGFEAVRLMVLDHRPEIHAWYRRLGFATTGKSSGFPTSSPSFPREENMRWIEMVKPLGS